MSQHAWFEHFKEQLHGLTESFESEGSSVSFLTYALQSQRLKSEAYLRWAMTHYMLPQLQPAFFNDLSLISGTFEKWQSHYPWSFECFPVAEWDGSLIVACLEPPADFPPSPTVAFVLATPESLHTTWQQLHPQAQNKKNALPPTPVIPASGPEGFDYSAATVVSPTQAPESVSFDDLGEMTQETSEEELALTEGEEKSETLEGVFDGPTVVQLKPLEATQIAGEAPKTLEESANEKTVVAPAGKGPVAVPLSSRTAKPKSTPVVDGHFSLEKIKTKNTQLDEKVKQAFQKMKVHFQKSLILTLDDEESQLKVFAWDESFRGMKDPSMRLPLKTPSMFNIVSATQKPFHGYISLNDINEQFFETWNQGQIPDHVTITPLIVQDKLVGMLMGLGEKSAYNKTSLGLAEKISSDFVKGLQAAS